MAKIKLSKEQQKAIAAAVMFLGGFGYIYISFFWMPTSAKIKDTKAKIDEVQGKIDKATRQAGRLPKLEQELVALNEQAIEAERRLPKAKSVPDILLRMSALAKKYRVDLTKFAPGGEVGKQFFAELNYPITIVGSYHDVGIFLAAIALEERIFNVQNVMYGAPGADGKMTVSFTLVGYQYKG